MRADEAANFSHRQVVLAHMHAVGLAEQGDVRVVVDDEQHARLTRQLTDLPALGDHLAVAFGGPFFAVLDDSDAAVDHGAHHFDIGAAA